MASAESDPLRSLERERDRLERLLEDDSAWRALRQLDQRETEGRPVSAVDAARLRARIEDALVGNRVFLARRKIDEAIALLLGPADEPAAAPPGEPTGECAARRPDLVVTIATLEARAAAIPVPSAPAVPEQVAADELTLIRGLDATLAARLRDLGVGRFADIARWTARDVREISHELGLERRVSRQNWIEQAALLAARQRRAAGAGEAETPPDAALMPAAAPRPETAQPPPLSRPVAELVAEAARRILASARRPQLPAVAAQVPLMAVAMPELAPEAAEPLPPPPEPAAPDDLTAIRGIDASTSSALAEAGIRGFADIAAWSAGDVGRMRDALGAEARIACDQWIEQAAMLAAGATTHHLRQRRQMEGIPLAALPPASATAPDASFAAFLARSAAAAVVVANESRADAGPVTQPAPHPGPTLSDIDPVPLIATPLSGFVEPAKPSALPARGKLQVSLLPQASPSPAAVTPAAGDPPHARAFPVLDLPELDLPLRSAAAEAPAAPAEAGWGHYDTLDLDFSEADVEIVARSQTGDRFEPEDSPRPMAAAGGPGSLQSRLRRAGEPEGFDGEGYAAYRGEVEEASVEIVHRTPASLRAAPAGIAATEADPDTTGPTTVRRFLKALTGQSR